MKKVLVIGGFGALGKSVIKTFKFSTPTWQTMSIDLNINNDADFNYIIQNGLNKEELKAISQSEFLQEDKLDCIVSVAGGWRGGSLEDEDLIENVQSMMTMNLYSSLLASHLAKRFLKEKSLFILTGANAVKENLNPGMIGYDLSKNSVHHLADLLISTTQLPKDSKLITILPTIIDTESNRKAMPQSDFSLWTKPDFISETIKNWADKQEYPKESYYKI